MTDKERKAKRDARNKAAYQEQAKHTLLESIKLRPDRTQLFMSMVVAGKADDCWFLDGRLKDCKKTGRPQFRFFGLRPWPAYQVMYALHYGDDLDGHEAHHTCENIRCVNPYHLEKLTPAEHKALHRELRKAA